jgi:hypothetical protein
MNDPKLVWQGQRREHQIMSADELRVRALEVQSRVRRNLLIALVVGFLLLLSSVFVMLVTPFTNVRLIAAGMVVVTLAIAYQAYSRIWLRQTSQENLASAGCLDFYRKELKAEYRSLQLTWRLLVPIVAFVYLIWDGILRGTPIVARIVLPPLLIFILFVRWRDRRNLKEKLLALDAFEREGS